jgi:hypothetical protein
MSEPTINLADIWSETRRLSAALATFLDLLNAPSSSIPSAYQTYESLWNHHTLLISLWNDHQTKDISIDPVVKRKVGARLEGLRPEMKQAKIVLDKKITEDVKSSPREERARPRPKPVQSRYSFSTFRLLSRRKDK